MKLSAAKIRYSHKTELFGQPAFHWEASVLANASQRNILKTERSCLQTAYQCAIFLWVSGQLVQPLLLCTQQRATSLEFNFGVTVGHRNRGVPCLSSLFLNYVPPRSTGYWVPRIVFLAGCLCRFLDSFTHQGHE